MIFWGGFDVYWSRGTHLDGLDRPKEQNRFPWYTTVRAQPCTNSPRIDTNLVPVSQSRHRRARVAPVTASRRIIHRP
eukprot:5655681-Prymnesium_polylepis.1